MAECSGHVIPLTRRIGELFVRGWFASTIGPHIVSWRPLSAPELVHERVHVAQWRRYGITMPLRYGLASLRVWRAGRRLYWDNPFEIEAYAAQAAAQSSEDSAGRLVPTGGPEPT